MLPEAEVPTEAAPAPDASPDASPEATGDAGDAEPTGEVERRRDSEPEHQSVSVVPRVDPELGAVGAGLPDSVPRFFVSAVDRRSTRPLMEAIERQIWGPSTRGRVLTDALPEALNEALDTESAGPET